MALEAIVSSTKTRDLHVLKEASVQALAEEQPHLQFACWITPH